MSTSTEAEPSKTIEIFCACADSAKDQELMQGLLSHLTPLQRENRIKIWHEYQLIAGTERFPEIDAHLNKAPIILIFVSVAFIESDYYYGQAMERALERFRAGEAFVIPILLRPVDWEATPLRELKPLPRNRKPIISVYWRNRDAAFQDIAKGIRAVVEEQENQLKSSEIAVNVPPKQPQSSGMSSPPVTVPASHETSAMKSSPELPDADKSYFSHHDSGSRLSGPKRTFGGPLRIPSDVVYSEGERTVMYIQRSRWALAVRLAIPVVLLLATLIGVLIAPFLFGYFATAFVLLLLVIGLIIINFVDDVFILTNKRIIDIDRRANLFFTAHLAVECKDIKAVAVVIPNFIGQLLNTGNLHIYLAEGRKLIMHGIDHPFFLQDEIFLITDRIKREEAAKAVTIRKSTAIPDSSSTKTIEERLVQLEAENKALQTENAILQAELKKKQTG